MCDAGAVKSAAHAVIALARRARALLALGASDQAVLLEATTELLVASLRLSRARDLAVLDGLAIGTSESPVAPAQVERARHLSNLVARTAGALPWRPTCLRQALALRRMLRRRGVPCAIHLGVTGVEGFAAHAWVTVGTVVILGGAGLPRYTELARFS